MANVQTFLSRYQEKDNKIVSHFASKKFLNKHFFALLALCLTVIAFIFVGWLWKPREYTFSGAVMGTTYHVKYITKRQSKEKQQIIAQEVSAALHEVDNRMSTYKPTSELMHLNSFPVNTPCHVSAELATVLKTSFFVSKLSDDFYDVTVGPLVNLWGFGPKSIKQKSPEFIAIQNGKQHPSPPTKEAIEQAKQEVGYKFIDLDMKTLTVVKKRKVFIDLSSIAKGYGVDKAAAALDHLNLHDYLVEVGGEIYVKGNRIDKKPWVVAIRSPENNVEAPCGTVRVSNKAVATSGDYLNYYDINHVRYNHEINPKTGFPEQNDIASVTVIASSTMLADAYSTMFMVLPRKTGQHIAEKWGLAVYILYRRQTNDDKQGFSAYISPAFKEYLNQQ